MKKYKGPKSWKVNWVCLTTDFSPDEYFKYKFADKTKKERNKYISARTSVDILKSPECNIMPDDKKSRCEMFAEYYKRDVIYLGFEDGASGSTFTSEREIYEAFIAKHDRFIVKPINGTKGHGIRIIESKDAPDYEKAKEVIKIPSIIEELITEEGDIALIHPQSVNTLRVVTSINKYGEYKLLFTLFRCGRDDSVVDNVGSGGIIAMVDAKTGHVCSDGFYAPDTYFDKHPNTGVEFKSLQMPAWEEMLKMVEKGHKKYPGQRVFGWDLAWNGKAWDVVEVNPAPSFSSYQVLTGHGALQEMKDAGIL